MFESPPYLLAYYMYIDILYTYSGWSNPWTKILDELS